MKNAPVSNLCQVLLWLVVSRLDVLKTFFLRNFSILNTGYRNIARCSLHWFVGRSACARISDSVPDTLNRKSDGCSEPIKRPAVASLAFSAFFLYLYSTSSCCSTLSLVVRNVLSVRHSAICSCRPFTVSCWHCCCHGNLLQHKIRFYALQVRVLQMTLTTSA